MCDLSRLLVRTTRASSDTVFRFDGEEFLVLVGRCRLEQSVYIAEKIRNTIKQELTTPNGPITASCGCAELSADEGRDQWIKRADEALYEAKKLGRDRVRPSLAQVQGGVVGQGAAGSGKVPA